MITTPKLNNFFKRNNENKLSENKIKKDPIINNIQMDNYNHKDEFKEYNKEESLSKNKIFFPL